jgi:DNA-binding CsgD family transcriptional regulator
MPESRRKLELVPVRRGVTPREAEILALAHLDNQAIADLLGIRRETVKTHLKRAYDKLGAANRTHAVMLMGTAIAA